MVWVDKVLQGRVVEGIFQTLENIHSGLNAQAA
ncbi:hypothetical protein Thi970DRAFT_00516 [Thiorhodovibrio frisius]|uniref:Uncharacterized protein n=1 Tax=Thiorhodovibrio frisius TaxID=631362 RepID=H8YWQ1_9GAMM|nr:hypothetical protein Thi970DRAFT_00516 [Thiorhodovibrio frisius]WPL22863.1 hypothetical protein Thiofri_03040 [Thiorhodovibrio frisius]